MYNHNSTKMLLIVNQNKYGGYNEINIKINLKTNK